MEGFVSNECGRFRFFDDTMAAAAATPTGPVNTRKSVYFVNSSLYGIQMVVTEGEKQPKINKFPRI